MNDGDVYSYVDVYDDLPCHQIPTEEDICADLMNMEEFRKTDNNIEEEND
jgi:hypothetical protein